jgi:hypothetical protein
VRRQSYVSHDSLLFRALNVHFACAEFAQDATQFLNTWTKINREWTSVFSVEGHPTKVAAFAAEHGHPRLQEFVSAEGDATATDRFDSSAFICDQAGGTLGRTGSWLGNTLAHVAAKHAKRNIDHHLELILVLVKFGADVATLRNVDGLTVVDYGKTSANRRLQQWAKDYGFFLGRYDFIGSPVHHSVTCLVIFAHDQERNQDVCLKFMHTEEQWRREIQMRVLGEFIVPDWHAFSAGRPESEPGPEPEPETAVADTALVAPRGRVRVNRAELLDAHHIVELCMDEDGLLDSRVLDTPKRASDLDLQSMDATAYRYLLVLPRARHDLSDAISHYRFAGRSREQVTQIGRLVAAHLRYLNEECRRIHGDLKPRNVIQIQDPEQPGVVWNLIDLDASCAIGELAGQKVTSSACFPPEMARQQLAQGTEMSAEEIQTKIVEYEDQLDTLNARRDRAEIARLNDEIELLEAKLSHDATPDPIVASVGFEMWYFGVLLYQLCTEDGETLWKSNQADDIGDDEMRTLAHQWESVKESKLKQVVWDDARELIGRLLSEDVADRPQVWLDVLDSPFLRVPDEEGVPPVDSNQGRNYHGLTSAEDFEQVQTAKVVHIISTPYDKANPVAGRKAVATKDFHDNPSKGIYVFNPNTGLRAAAEAQHLSEEEQGRQWLRLWTEVMDTVVKTGGKCFVMAKSTGPDQYILEGGAQSGEINIAKFALDPEPRSGHVGPAGWECVRIEYVLY